VFFVRAISPSSTRARVRARAGARFSLFFILSSPIIEEERKDRAPARARTRARVEEMENLTRVIILFF